AVAWSAVAEARIPELPTVVTGVASTRGIGRGVARVLAGEGRPLALLDRDTDGLEEAAEQARAAGAGLVVTARADIADPASVDTAGTDVEAAGPPVADLVNCARIGHPSPVLEMTSASFQRTLTINTTGLFHLAQRVLPGMLEQGLGRIVAVGSTAAQDGGGNFSTSAYAASKAGVEGLLRG